MGRIMTDETVTRVHGKHYDLKSFEHLHPGGADLLKLAYGNDATELIYSYHKNPQKIFKRLAAFEIKRDAVCPAQNYSIETPFFMALKHKINRYFTLTKKNRRSGLGMRSLILILITIISYCLSLNGYLIFSPIFGIALACIGLCIHHDANHGAYSSSAKLNHFLGLAGDLIGSSSLIWRYQHCFGHHVYCNDTEQDPDTKVGLPWFRLHSSQSLYRYMKYQHYYCFFLYALMGALAPFWSIYEFIARKHDTIQLQVIRRRDLFEFWFMKVLYFIYMIIIPLHVLGIAMLWKFYLPVQLVGGLYLGTLFALNHNNHKVFSTDKKAIQDWAILQIVNSANWSSQSKFWNVISGGLNCQIEHHLFPSISHIHYPALHRLVKKSCQQYQIPYYEYSFKALLIDHFLFLKKLGSSL